jgi:phosphoribosylformylglycinamidine cyclo-ligase
MARSRYRELGVDPLKVGVDVFRGSVSPVYSHAFCDIFLDPDIPGYGFVHHTDGAGSKPVQNYLNWRETDNLEAFRGVAQDTLAMNLGDIFCVGIPTSCSFADYVTINGFPVPKKEFLAILSDDFKRLFEMLASEGIKIIFTGGETADLPDQLRTFDVGGSICARYRLDSLITGEDIAPGDAIVGISSGGIARYEREPPGPGMCNGYTLLRHCLMSPAMSDKYPEILQPGKDYYGPFSPTDEVDGIEGTIGEEITRPARIFAPVFRGVIGNFGNAVHGIVFNTGGGHTKCLRIGEGIRYVKDDLPEPDEIFKLAQRHGRVPWREMHVDFNMGVGAEVITDPGAAQELSSYIAEAFFIDADRIGECRRAVGKNKVRLETQYGNFNFPTRIRTERS